MQKWMRDRMRRRKNKPADESPAAENNSPLQPVYPDEEPKPETSSESEQASEPSEQVEPASEVSEAAVSEPERARPKRRRKKKAAKTVAPPVEESPEPVAVTEPVTEEVPPVTEEAQPQAEVEQQPEQQTEPVAAEEAVPVEAAPVTEPEPVPAPVAQAPATPPAKGTGKRSSKGAVVLAVGLPGSGKSTWFKRHAVTPLSSDMVRHLLFDNSTEQRYQDLVFGTLRSLLRARLIARMPMNYVDATNLSPKERRHWIRMAKDFGYEAHAVYFDVPLEVCMERNRRRNRVVPEDVMQRMAAKLRPPSFDEGFAKIIVVRVKPKAQSAGDQAESAAEPTSTEE